MTVNIESIKFEATQKLQEHITKKVNKLEHFFDEIITADVTLKVIKPETTSNKEASVRVNVPGQELFASKVCDSFEEAVDTAVEAIEKQIMKYKEKIKS
jgi:putative sigma-54 modulation protein